MIMAFDLVIRNGMIVDGSGLGAYRADVGVVGDRIAAIGRIKTRGRQEIDAEGLAVTPGFIDGHTHLDAQIFWDPIGANSCWHGVTTVVMGNCGFTLAPSAEKDAMLVVRSLERAEDISGKAMAAGIRWSWTTFAEYLDAIDALPKGIHYAANIGHSALRTYAMGERAFEETANADDLRVMQTELRAALAAGAIGFTTSRTHQHRTSDDRPVASRLAAWSEVEALVRTMGETGQGIFQYVEDPAPPDRADARRDELISLSASTGVPFAVPALLDAKRVLPMLDLATARGARMFGLAHCRGIGTMSSFRSQLPFDRLPVWRDLRALPLEEQRARLADRALVERLVQSAHESRYGEAVGGEARPPEFDRMRVLDAPVPPNPTVAEAARARGLDPVELMIQLALETDLRQFFVQTLSPFDMDDITAILRHPQAVLSFSDSGAHVSQMSDASLQTHLLAHWVRALRIFTFEEAIRMITLAPARAWGFHDRGLVREGLIADLNVLDPAKVAPAMPRVVHDLPAGERRIEQRSTGIAATVVAGQVLVRDGEHTGALPGRLLRKAVAH
jgi:N-acyl-D-amino-acid deacylase